MDMSTSYFAIRKGRRVAVSRQRKEAAENGFDPDRFLDLDEVSVDRLLGWDDQEPLLRRGNKVGVLRFEFFAPVSEGQPSRMLKRITDRMLELGVVVEELESGLSCKDEQGVYRIYSGALARLAPGRRHQNPGRPKEHHYTDADCQIIQAAWHGSPVKNPAGRTAAVNALTGEDGKPRFPKFKQSTWYTLKNAGRVK